MSEAARIVSIAASGSGPYGQIVTVGDHILFADEPVLRGGRDTGPSPYEFLLAGLGACTAVTVRMYADRHSWLLRMMKVELWHEKVATADGTAVDHFHRIITLEGNLSGEQRLRLFQIAERCPVSETLRRVGIVESNLVDTV